MAVRIYRQGVSLAVRIYRQGVSVAVRIYRRGCQWQFVFTETERVSVAVRIYRQGMSVTVHIHTNRGGVRGNSYSQRQGVSVAESVHY